MICPCAPRKSKLWSRKQCVRSGVSNLMRHRLVITRFRHGSYDHNVSHMIILHAQKTGFFCVSCWSNLHGELTYCRLRRMDDLCIGPESNPETLKVFLSSQIIQIVRLQRKALGFSVKDLKLGSSWIARSLLERVWLWILLSKTEENSTGFEGRARERYFTLYLSIYRLVP